MNAADLSALSELLDRVKGDNGDVAVASVVLREVDDGPDALLWGSVLFGPADLADASWPEWAAMTSRTMRSAVARWTGDGADLASWRRFEFRSERYVFARWTWPTAGTAGVVEQWLPALLTGSIVQAGTATPFEMAATAATSPVMATTFPAKASPAGRFVDGAHRPVRGVLFPLSSVDGVDGGDANRWASPVGPPTDALRWLLGVDLSDANHFGEEPRRPTQPGLFVGRLERRAWFTELKLSRDLSTYTVRIAIDEDRIDVADLEVDLEEHGGDELLLARRTKLGDLKLPGVALAPGEMFAVRLPTLGRGVRRVVRLYDRDGLLLDMSEAFWTLEGIDLTVQVGGATTTTRVGEPALPPPHGLSGVAALNAHLDRVDVEYSDLLRDGIDDRIVDDPAAGAALLTAALAKARGSLSILDPFFGHHDQSSWALLAGVRVPIRVLTTRRGSNPTTIPVGVTRAPSVGVRVVRKVAGPAPWHDRLYLWDGGGLTVGTSPNGLGRRLARIDRLSSAEAAAWSSWFNTWWYDTTLTEAVRPKRG